MMYSQDGLGLGHMRRTSSIANQIAQVRSDAAILTMADSQLGQFFETSKNHDYLKLPSILKAGPGDWRAVSLPLPFADVHAMRRELISIEPNIIFLDNQTMDAQVSATLLPAKAGAIAVSAVGIVAMVLASIGLYGVIAYSVARRTREIGIRMALGAKPSAVVGLVMKQGLALAAIGVGVGGVLALGAAKAVAGALYGVSFVDPVAWGSAIVTLLAVSMLANLMPARRASIVDPSSALRSE